MSKSLFGYGITTKSISKSGGWNIFDDRFIDKKEDELGNFLLNPKEFNPDESSLEIPSPSFPREHTLTKSAKHLISEYDYFKDKMPFNVWISGTNGKTTTTQMIQFLLKQFGSVDGGNIGTPLGDLDQKAKIWILETSSFTIHYTKQAYPDIYVLLPISPDHLAWHGGLEEYIKAKLKPLSMMKEGSVAIIPSKFKNIQNTMATALYYDNEEDLSKICKVDLDKIAFKPPFLMDALMALCVEKIIFDKAEIELLNEFIIKKNKLEKLKDSKSRLWVNDTKATNLDAVMQAVNRYKDKKIHLILGGDDKGVDLTELFYFISTTNTKVYAIGKSAENIINLCKKFDIPCEKCIFLENAVKEIDKSLMIGEVGLLSPACASWDQFESYAQRGDDFKKFVKNL